MPMAGSVICIRHKSFYVVEVDEDLPKQVTIAPIVDGEVRLDLLSIKYPIEIEPWRLMRKKTKLVLA